MQSISTTSLSRRKQLFNHAVGLTIGTAIMIGLLGTMLPLRAGAQQKTEGLTVGPPVIIPKTPPPRPPMTTSRVTVLQGHNNSLNTGENYLETLLTPMSVFLDPNSIATGKFGKLFTRPLDGAVYGQPLYVPNVYFSNVPHLTLPSTPDSYHNVVYVVTENNDIYAWDADDNLNNNVKPLWYKTFNYPSLLIGPVSTDQVGSVDITPQISITGTPIITTTKDPVTGGTDGTIYLVSKVQNGNDFFQYIHALDLATGAEKYGAPIQINASYPGTGDDSILDQNGDSVVPFDALYENEQAALKMLSDNSTLVLSWGGHGNTNPLHGWVMTYKIDTVGKSIKQTGVFCLSPNGVEDVNSVPAGGGVWAGGAGPAIDEFDNIYVSTGVGNFDVDLGGTEYDQSVVKINFNQPNNGPGVPPQPNWPVIDYFTPFDWLNQTQSFSDLGSGGVVVIPDGVGPVTNPNLVVAAGVEGTIYLLDRGTTAGAQTMGFYNAGIDSQIVQSLPMSVGPVYGVPAYSTPTRTLFYQGSGDVLKAFTFGQDMVNDPNDYGYLVPFGNAQSEMSDQYGKNGVFDYPGATPVITGDGVNYPASNPGNTLVWTLERQIVPSNINDENDINPANLYPNPLTVPFPGVEIGPFANIGALTPIGVLHAYDANPAHWTNGVIPEVYNALGTGARDVVSNPTNFAVPTVANGKVYVGSANQLTVFGLFPAGSTPTGAQADHYLVTGPVNYMVSIGLTQGTPGAIAVNQKQSEYYMITAIGPDDQPVKLTGSVQVYYRDFDTQVLHSMTTVKFANSANAVFSYAFTTTNSNGYDIYVVDSYGHNSYQPNANNPFVNFQSTSGTNNIFGVQSAPVYVAPTNTRGLDHLVMQVASSVRSGNNISVTIKAVTATGTILPTVSGTLFLYDAIPAGIGPDGNPVPVQQFTNQPGGIQGWAYDNVPYLGEFPFATPLQSLTLKNGIGTALYPIVGVGPHILVATGGTITGTSLVNAVK